MAQIDEVTEVKNEDAQLNFKVETSRRTYRSPIFSLYQSAAQQVLLDQNISIDDIDKHDLMKEVIQFLDTVESGSVVNKLLDDAQSTVKTILSKANMFIGLNNYQKVHKINENPAASVFCAAIKDIFANKQEEKTQQIQMVDISLQYSTFVNLIQYDEHDWSILKRSGWAECLTYFKKYLSECKKSIDLHYMEYDEKSKDKCEFEIPDVCYHKDGNFLRIGILGDWGGGNKLAQQTIDGLISFKPDLIIHLGDVYYSGTEKEFINNYFKVLNKARENHKCPIFSIPGNHDYYAGGKPFYDVIQLLNPDSYVPKWFSDKKYEQKYSFWTLKHSKFYLCGLDTGYGSGDALKEGIKGLFGGGSHPKLHKKESTFHTQQFDAAIKDNKNIIIFSHHPLFSAFENVCVDTELQKRFSAYLPKVQYWFWGHEHNFAVYDKHMNLPRGRLMGHGCIPVIVKKDKNPHSVRKGNKVPLLAHIGVKTSKFENKTICNTGFGYIDLNMDGSSDAYYYEIKQTDPKNPHLTHKENASWLYSSK
eukprot:422452_1